jgi:4-hydroxybenzoate polyprenyltransferase
MTGKTILLIKQYFFPRLVVDIFFFYSLLVILGTLASDIERGIDWAAIVLTTYLMTIFSFLYNDMEDAEDDAQSKYKYVDPWNHFLLTLGFKNQYNTGGKRFKNPFAFDDLSRGMGYLLLLIIADASLLLSYIGGGWLAVAVCLSCLFTGFAYSNKTIRLKARPLLDLLSHSYLLAGAQIFLFMAITHTYFEVYSVIILLGAMIFSMGSDLENEFRDYEEDMAADIKNTSYYIGKVNAKRFSIATKLIGCILIFCGVILGI